MIPAESGLLLINKPRGMASFGVISHLRRLTGIRRIGHAGTLDPFADGLLVTCLGRATAAVQFMESYDKTYRLVAEFGRATDTQDWTGQTIFSRDLTPAEREDLQRTDFASLRQAVQNLVGERQQTPPMFSAVKVAGRPLYQYARQGREVRRDSRSIRIYRAEIEDITLRETLRATMSIRCSKGTYIRTLADGLGSELGYGAHAARLSRLTCGPFDLSQALEPDQLQVWRDQCPDQSAFRGYLVQEGLLLPVDRAFAGFGTLQLTDPEAERLISGQELLLTEETWSQRIQVPGDVASAGPIAAFGRGRVIAAVRPVAVKADCIQIKPERVLVDLADFRQL
ncbi:MAG TPA: tRNA pseudouridine(55) synthase TruB [Clostridiales bacterium]|nr:tRNA pseudouridine(55) synthase TruB [Clostridiales bacterium]